MLETEILHGTIDRIIYQNGENGFAVFIIQVNSTTTITAKGYVPVITAGEQVVMHGSWNMHQKFGKQFDVRSCEKQAPTSIVGLKNIWVQVLLKE